jgi:hypothetical protein
MKGNEVQRELVNTVKHGGEREQMFVLNIANVCDSIFDSLQSYRART